MMSLCMIVHHLHDPEYMIKHLDVSDSLVMIFKSIKKRLRCRPEFKRPKESGAAGCMREMDRKAGRAGMYAYSSRSLLAVLWTGFGLVDYFPVCRNGSDALHLMVRIWPMGRNTFAVVVSRRNQHIKRYAAFVYPGFVMVCWLASLSTGVNI